MESGSPDIPACQARPHYSHTPHSNTTHPATRN